mmetsp:Transcript_540/g.1250  ORF Transcript_540/g.1250 Transcript_540/m.1250 type:complete len:327 (-) Transcript_540:2182-3162(-)
MRRRPVLPRQVLLPSSKHSSWSSAPSATRPARRAGVSARDPILEALIFAGSPAPAAPVPRLRPRARAGPGRCVNVARGVVRAGRARGDPSPSAPAGLQGPDAPRFTPRCPRSQGRKVPPRTRTRTRTLPLRLPLPLPLLLPLRLLRSETRQRSMAAPRPSREEINQFFKSVDENNNGFLDAMELQKCLAMSQLSFSLAVCAQMIRAHGRARDGSVTCDEFANLHNNLQDYIDNFKAFDTEKNGKLTLAVVRQAITKVGYNLDDTAFYTCCKAFDPDRTADMGMPEFIAMNIFLKSASNTFRAFDFQRSGQIALNFGQFIYAAANTR